MSTLIVHECDTEVFQEFTPTENSLVTSFRPHLYFHNSPSGDIKMRLTDSSGNQIAESSSSVIATLKAAVEADSSVGVGAFVHAYVLFDFNVPLMKNVAYRIYVTCFNGYSFAESAYVAVCKDWDDPKITPSYSPSVDFNAALDIEIWERRNL